MATRWWPDTCGCCFDVEDDWASAASVEICDRHKNHEDKFTAAHGDNRKKNLVLKDIKDSSKQNRYRWLIDDQTGVLTVSTTMPDGAVNALRGKYPDVVFVTDSTISLDPSEIARG